MTREEAISFGNMWLELNEDAKDSETYQFVKKAISVLSADGEYIKKEDTIGYLNDLFGEMCQVSFGDALQSIDSLQTYSFPDSAEISEIKEPRLLESFKDGADKVVEIWAVKGKLQIRTHGTIHNCNGTFGNNISVKSVNGFVSVFPDPENKGEWIYDKSINNWRCSKCGQTPPPTGYVGDTDFMAAHFKFCNHCGMAMKGASE